MSFLVPTVPVSCGCLLFDTAGRLLGLKPTYKKGGTIPGGITEDDGEIPWVGCRREVREETGLDVDAGTLVAVDTRPDKRTGGIGLRFLFRAGVPLTDGDLAADQVHRRLNDPDTRASAEGAAVFGPPA